MRPMTRQKRRIRPVPCLVLACVLGAAGTAGVGLAVANLGTANQLNADTRLIEVTP